MVEARSFTSFKSPADLIEKPASKGIKHGVLPSAMLRKRLFRAAGIAFLAAAAAGFADLLPDRMAEVSRSV